MIIELTSSRQPTNLIQQLLPYKLYYSCYCDISKEIRQWPINCRTSPLMTHKITPSVDLNQWLERLNTQLNKPTNQNLVKVPKVVELTNKKMILNKTLGTSVILQML